MAISKLYSDFLDLGLRVADPDTPAAGQVYIYAIGTVMYARFPSGTIVAFSPPALASGAEINTGTDDTKAVSPKAINDSYLGNRGVCQFRPSFVSGDPMWATASAKTTLYIVPFDGCSVSLFDGTVWRERTSAEFSISLAGLTASTNYRCWIYDNGGTPTAELQAWTNPTTPPTTVWLNGRLVKSGATTRLYFCDIRINAAGGQVDDTASVMGLFSYYNTRKRILTCKDPTDTWNYTTATWRKTNNSSVVGVARVELLLGVPRWVKATNYATCYNASSVIAASGIALDVENANHAYMFGGYANVNGAVLPSFYEEIVAIGYHYLQRVEYSAAAGTTTWQGDAANPGVWQTGMIVNLEC